MKLVCNEVEVMIRLGRAVRVITCSGIGLIDSFSPRPEIISECVTDGMHKWLVWVMCEKCLKFVNIDWGDDFKQIWM